MYSKPTSSAILPPIPLELARDWVFKCLLWGTFLILTTTNTCLYTHRHETECLAYFFVCMYTLIIFKRTAFLINLGFINAFIGPTPVPAYYWSSTNIYWKVRQWNLPCPASDCESCLFSSQMATTLKEVTPNLAQIFARSKYPCLASGCSSIVECLPGI